MLRYLLISGAVLLMISCQGSGGGGTPSPTPEEKDYEKPRAAFEQLISEYQQEADEKGKVHFDAYKEMASLIRNIYVQVDDKKENAQVTLISYRGMQCLYNPSPIDEIETWTAVGDNNKKDCEKALQKTSVNVVSFEDGYIVRVKGIVALDLDYIALTRFQLVSVEESNDKRGIKNHFADHFVGKVLKTQASHAIYPETLTDVRRNSFYLSEKDGNAVVWTDADQSEEGKIHFLARSSNIGMGEFHAEGSEFEGQEVTTYAKEASLEYETNNYLLDIHRILTNGLDIQSSDPEVVTQLTLKFVEE